MIYSLCLTFSKDTRKVRKYFLSYSESESEVAQSYPTLCDPVDCGLPGSSLHGILQARILKWVAISSPGDLPKPGIELEILHCRQML